MTNMVKIKGVSLTKLVGMNHNVRQRIRQYLNKGLSEAELNACIDKELEAFKERQERRKKHPQKENLKKRRQALGVSASFMARQMGFGQNYYRVVEKNETKLCESFYKKFCEVEEKLKNILKCK